MIILALDRLQIYKNPSTTSFTLKKVQQQSYARNAKALVPRNDQKFDQNTLEIGRKLGRANIEVL